MGTKHTPGSWTVEHQQPTPQTNGTLITDRAGDTVARVYGISDPNDGEGGKEAYANARLIAAAPDLLEAAKLMLGYGPGKMPDGRDTYDVLRDAVARAEGEPTCEHTSCTQRGADWVCDACHAKVRL
jgi:hypothetical protein